MESFEFQAPLNQRGSNLVHAVFTFAQRTKALWFRLWAMELWPEIKNANISKTDTIVDIATSVFTFFY